MVFAKGVFLIYDIYVRSMRDTIESQQTEDLLEALHYLKERMSEQYIHILTINTSDTLPHIRKKLQKLAKHDTGL